MNRQRDFMVSSTILIGFGISGILASAGYLLISRLDRYTELVDERLRTESRGRPLPRRRALKRTTLTGEESSKNIFSWSAILSHLAPNRDADRRKHQSRLMQAGIYSPTALSAFFGVKLVLLTIPPLIGVLVTTGGVGDYRLNLLFGCAAGIIGMILPSFWLERKIRQRHAMLRRALPDMLDLTTVCLEGGLSLQGALQRVGDELRMAHPILSDEFLIVQRDINLGASVYIALRRLSDRTGFDGLRQLGTLVRDAQRHGAELADALRVHADTLRSQREAEGEEKAQKASVKILIPTLLFIFPAVFVVLAGPAAIRIHESFSQSKSGSVQKSK